MLGRRKSARLLGAAILALAMVLLIPASANADWSFYRTQPHMGACWTRVTAYGGVYQVQTIIVNDSPSYQTGQIVVHRPSEGIIQNQSWTAAPGEWKAGPTAHVAIVPGDTFRYYLNGVRVAEIPQHGIPYYMSHCSVVTSPSPKINRAVSYGLAQLGSYYTGCYGGSYRMGGVASTDMLFDGRKCGQSWVYSLPKGGKGFDCSGLVYKMFQFGQVHFPYSSTAAMRSDGSNILDPVSRSSIRTGDLLLKSGHVGVYVGNNLVLEASPSHGAIVNWVYGEARQVTEAVQLTPLSQFPASSGYTVQRVRGT